jgi:hypothetical protein
MRLSESNRLVSFSPRLADDGTSSRISLHVLADNGNVHRLDVFINARSDFPLCQLLKKEPEVSLWKAVMRTWEESKHNHRLLYLQ